MSEIQCVVQGLFGELRAAIEELLLPGAEQRDALRTLEEASMKHYPGPFLSSVHEDELEKMSIDASLNTGRQICENYSII